MPGVLTWLGHSTVLLELDGARMITDPLMRPRVAHLLRQVADPGDPGRLDAILISHGHHDHLDPASLRRLDPDAPVVAPPAAARSLRGTRRTVHTLERRGGGRAGGRARRGGQGRPRRSPDPARRPLERRRLRGRRRLLRGRHRAVPGDGEPGGDARRGAAAGLGLGAEDRARPHGRARGRGGARAAAARARGPDPLGHLPPHRPPAERRSRRASSPPTRPSSRRTCGSRCSSRAARSRSPGRCDSRSPRAGRSVGA